MTLIATLPLDVFHEGEAITLKLRGRLIYKFNIRFRRRADGARFPKNSAIQIVSYPAQDWGGATQTITKSVEEAAELFDAFTGLGTDHIVQAAIDRGWGDVVAAPNQETLL